LHITGKMVDLKTNQSQLKDAWREVTDVNSPVNWALLGYEGQTNVLKLVSKGEDGVEEMTEDLNPSKIMYGFLSIEDPKTSLPKFVIINWQGETAPGGRKGMCAMHLRDIERFLQGHHLTLNVRNEDDIDMDDIVKKLSNITGSSYNFKAKPQGMEHSPEPVGTVHKKINPLQELPNMTEREKFWSRDQDEEKKRVVSERERRNVEAQKVEEERKKREEQENTLREGQIKERERKISKLRESDKKAEEEIKSSDRARWEQQQTEDALDSQERSQRSERMRQERKKEALELVQNRSADARKVFTRNSSQGQMSFPKPPVPSNAAVKDSPAAPPPPAATAAPPPPAAAAAAPPAPEPVFSPAEQTDPGSDQIAPPPGFQEEEETGPKPEEAEAPPPPREEVHHATPVNLDKEEINGGGKGEDKSLESYGVCAVSLYDYQASDETEISFDPGQIITHIDQIDPGWWQGLGPDGSYGLFPANYVEIIDNSELQIQ